MSMAQNGHKKTEVGCEGCVQPKDGARVRVKTSGRNRKRASRVGTGVGQRGQACRVGNGARSQEWTAGSKSWGVGSN